MTVTFGKRRSTVRFRQAAQTTGEVCAHLAEVYGTDVSEETISTITGRVLDSFAEWQSRPLDAVYPVVAHGAPTARSVGAAP